MNASSPSTARRRTLHIARARATLRCSLGPVHIAGVTFERRPSGSAQWCSRACRHRPQLRRYRTVGVATRATARSYGREVRARELPRGRGDSREGSMRCSHHPGGVNTNMSNHTCPTCPLHNPICFEPIAETLTILGIHTSLHTYGWPWGVSHTVAHVHSCHSSQRSS